MEQFHWDHRHISGLNPSPTNCTPKHYKKTRLHVHFWEIMAKFNVILIDAKRNYAKIHMSD